MRTLSGEPTLNGIEDYDNNESQEKRRVIWIVIITGLIIGGIFTYFKNNSLVSDKISGTTDIIQIQK
ncbi:hypothetical protein MNB_SV-15-287 [hydrothermal vent metagenome]|uniref:Uncharacterized protein n=1 Tax=hydrothermal vent metagenome TaxID=652676 RepID=A0A1W1EIJ8_9ZZZZ